MLIFIKMWLLVPLALATGSMLPLIRGNPSSSDDEEVAGINRLSLEPQPEQEEEQRQHLLQHHYDYDDANYASENPHAKLKKYEMQRRRRFGSRLLPIDDGGGGGGGGGGWREEDGDIGHEDKDEDEDEEVELLNQEILTDSSFEQPNTISSRRNYPKRGFSVLARWKPFTNIGKFKVAGRQAVRPVAALISAADYDQISAETRAMLRPVGQPLRWG